MATERLEDKHKTLVCDHHVWYSFLLEFKDDSDEINVVAGGLSMNWIAFCALSVPFCQDADRIAKLTKAYLETTEPMRLERITFARKQIEDPEKTDKGLTNKRKAQQGALTISDTVVRNNTQDEIYECACYDDVIGTRARFCI